jgi:hypothetical protein
MRALLKGSVFLAGSAGLAAAALAGPVTTPPLRSAIFHPSGPAFIQPYNLHMIPMQGDSRTAMGGGAVVSGTNAGSNQTLGLSTSYTQVPTYLGNRIRFGSQINMGIGGETAAQALGWPRAISVNTSTVSITGNQATITVGAGSYPILPGTTRILAQGAITTANITAFVSGTSGGSGVYTIDGAAQTVSSTSGVTIGYTGGSTIAETAANEAAIIFLGPLGTNSSGASTDLTAMGAAITALTTPGFPYPNYRPNGEATDQPLPLYGGLPKTIILINDTRRGTTTLGAINSVASNPSQFASYAGSLLRYSYDSGNAAYANTHVIGVDTFNDPVTAVLSDTTNYQIKAGFAPDGLHQTSTFAVAEGQQIAARVGAVIPATYDYGSSIVTTATQATVGAALTQNGTFTTCTGGDYSPTAPTSGTVPNGFRFITTNFTGMQYTVTCGAGGNSGNEVAIHITGNPTADWSLQFLAKTNAILTAGIAPNTDNLRAMARTKLVIAAGDIYNAALTGIIATSAHPNATINAGLAGTGAGYGNNSAYPMFIKNAYYDGSHAAYQTEISGNAGLVGTGDTGPITSATLNYTIAGKTTTPVDVTITLSQMAIMKVVD